MRVQIGNVWLGNIGRISVVVLARYWDDPHAPSHWLNSSVCGLGSIVQRCQCKAIGRHQYWPRMLLVLWLI